MKWSDKLDEWNKGNILNYPTDIKKRFFYETSFCNKDNSSEYKEVFIESNSLNNLEEDYSNFEDYIKSSKNKYIVSFSNLSGDSILIIPIPKKNKDFTTIKDFIDNASIYHQKQFWKKVVKEIKKTLKNNEKIYVSTHGLGVPYFHLRLDKYPKYYHTKNLQI
jgi:hypothetical protein